MRLTCPNCGAQYEVPDDVIPQDGRDVQCSNCGTTWFQPHASVAATEAEQPDPEELRQALNDLGETPPPAAETPEPEPEDELPEQAPMPVPEPTRKELASDVTDILREEASLEAQRRAEEAEALESQPDLGLDDIADDADRRAQQARARMERLKGPSEDTQLEVAVAAAAAAAQTSRRDQLPDIDEINSSLRANDSAAHPEDLLQDPEPGAKRKGSFARGFAIPLLLMAILLLIYTMAPRIAEAVPALGPALTTYVLTVDQARQWLDSQIGTLLQ